MITNHFDVQGLSDLEVIESRKKFGQNRCMYIYLQSEIRTGHKKYKIQK